jgi:hypothetical protein
MSYALGSECSAKTISATAGQFNQHRMRAEYDKEILGRGGA